MHSIIISKSTSSLGVRTSSNIITNTTRTVAPDGYRRGRWTPKDKEPSQDHSSSEIPEEPARYCRTCSLMQPCSDGRARPPRWHGDVPPPRCPDASPPSLAHATATKQGSGQQRAASSPTYVPRKVAPPNTNPAEPSPEHGPDQAGLHRRVDDDEDAG